MSFMRRDGAYIEDILRSAERIVYKIDGLSFEEFDIDFDLQDIIIRRLTIIGEASNRLSKEFRSRYPILPYAQMRGMRNFIVHEYDEIDTEIIWKTCQEEIPKLIDLIKEINT